MAPVAIAERVLTKRARAAHREACLCSSRVVAPCIVPYMDMISLERHAAARNMARYYCLTVEKNFFGEWSLVCEWGRIGRSGYVEMDL
jgi:WGR domain-containing protein